MKHAIMTGSASVSEAAWQELRASLAADQPDLNCGLVLHELRAFATWRGAQFPLTVPPSQQEVERYLAACSAEHGSHLAALKLHRIQSAACVLWGMPYASLIAIVRRQRQRGHRGHPEHAGPKTAMTGGYRRERRQKKKMRGGE